MGERYRSETDKYRSDLAGYCVGNGVDIGYGGDPIVPSAITIDNPDGLMANCGDHPINLAGDATSLRWFRGSVLDYVYSSHCLEDFQNTVDILSEWLRVLKTGGRLVLLLPDQKRYERYCSEHGEQPNEAHKISEFGLKYLKGVLASIPNTKVVFENDIIDDYNFQIVVEKTAHGSDIAQEDAANERIGQLKDELDAVKENMSECQRELDFVKSSKFWKVREWYSRLKGNPEW